MTVQEKGHRVQISLNVSPKLYQTLNNVAKQLNGDPASEPRTVIVLMQLAVDAQQQGKHLWIADENAWLSGWEY